MVHGCDGSLGGCLQVRPRRLTIGALSMRCTARMATATARSASSKRTTLRSPDSRAGTGSRLRATEIEAPQQSAFFGTRSRPSPRSVANLDLAEVRRAAAPLEDRRQASSISSSHGSLGRCRLGRSELWPCPFGRSSHSSGWPSGTRSTHRSHGPIGVTSPGREITPELGFRVEQTTGIERASSAWK